MKKLAVGLAALLIIGAPASSLTWPWMPVVICCAWAGAATTVATLIAIRLAAIE